MLALDLDDFVFYPRVGFRPAPRKPAPKPRERLYKQVTRRTLDRGNSRLV